jgi:hypothetical protein
MQFLTLLAYVATASTQHLQSQHVPQTPEPIKEQLQPLQPQRATTANSEPLNSTTPANGHIATPVSVPGTAVAAHNIAAGLGPQSVNNGHKVGTGFGIVIVSVYLLI